MSSEDSARRTAIDLQFAGVNVTKNLRPYLISMQYTDEEDSSVDDLQIRLQDRDSAWLKSWLNDIVTASAKGSFKIRAAIDRLNWAGKGIDTRLCCGEFELDTVEASGPPAIVTIKGTGLPFAGSVRQTKKTRGWESYTLSGIGKQIANESGLGFMFEAASDPGYQRLEQYRQSDMQFLERLCKNAGMSIKATDRMIVIFDKGKFEARAPVRTIRRGGGCIKYSLPMRKADAQYSSCRVSCTDPLTGRCIEGIARSGEGSQQLEIKAKVNSPGEAQAMAEAQLKLHNKFSMSPSFTLPGDPVLLSGNTVRLAGWGAFDGKHIINSAVHKVDNGGYTTQVKLRKA